MDRAELDQWLTGAATGSLDGPLAHLRLIQNGDGTWRGLLPAMTAYFEDAHRDARRIFHEDAGLSLDPLTDGFIQYPSAMPAKTRRGYFGEVMCAVIATRYELVLRKQWHVPVFLFRCHNAAGEYLMRRLNGDDPNANVPGRTGSDCIGVAQNQDGSLAALLVGEAKCHETFNINKAKEGLKNLGIETCLPVSIGQLRRVLVEAGGPDHARLVESLETLILTRASQAVPRVDFLLYAFDRPGVVKYAGPRITEAIVQEAYTGGRPLQVVELHSPELTSLVTALYDGLYAPTGGHDATT